MYKQQRDAAVGKDDVGIAANGLKVFFALSSYYNEYYNDNFSSEVNTLRRNAKTFKKQFTFINDGKVTKYNLGTISDINISNSQESDLKKAIGEYEVFRENTALALSAFTSAATDNAKELLMAKINANVELASMHIYLLILGLTPEQIVNIMVSPVIERVIQKLETNLFYDSKVPMVNVILDAIINDKKEDGETVQNAKSLRDIYNGAQEIKFLARILGVNQKASANIEELNNFLTTFETIVYARENSIFKDSLSDFDL
jgi:hypothetical protein